MIQPYTIRFAAFAVCLLISLILAGCGKPSDTSTESGTPTKNQNAARSAGAKEEKQRISSLPPGEKLAPLTEGQAWVSEDGAYTALIPKNWTLLKSPFGGSTGWRAPNIMNMIVAITSSQEAQTATVEEETKRLLSQANYIGASAAAGQGGYKTLEDHTGEIGGFPAAWTVITFKVPGIGQVNILAVAIGTPTTVYSIFAMARRSDFDKLRPTLEGIAGSFKLK